MSAKYHDLENKRIFVTGGGSGIGASIVEHFCEQKLIQLILIKPMKAYALLGTQSFEDRDYSKLGQYYHDEAQRLFCPMQCLFFENF